MTADSISSDYPPEKKKKVNCIERVQGWIVGALELLFFKYGKTVASHPFIFILLCLAIAGLCSIGLLNYRQETNGNKLWIPTYSSQRINSEWLQSNYPNDKRFASMIFVSDNVLTPGVIQTMYQVRKSVEKVVTQNNVTWSSICVKVPVVRDENKSQNGSSANTSPNAVSIQTYPEPYCTSINSMPTSTVCLETSILELWGNNGAYDSVTDSEIASLTQQTLLDKINGVNKSGIFLGPKKFANFLGEISYDQNGRIIGAKATLMSWFSKVYISSAARDVQIGENGIVDAKTLEFEADMLKVMLNTTGYPSGLTSYPNAQRSFSDVAGSSINGDLSLLTSGFLVVFIYVMFMLGKLSCVEQRVYLSLAGICSILMGIIVSYGFCSGVGLFFGPLHNILPFLLLGIGIDDMFVIVQTWDSLTPEEQEKSFVEKFGLTMAQSGVAITITSVTDIVAFAVGSISVLPALMSFSLYAAVGILAIYFFQCTFFVACMAIDQKRIESDRNGCFPCYKHKDYKPNDFVQKNYSHVVFAAYSNFLMKTPIKVIVIISIFLFTGFAIWGCILLEQKFDPIWFLPPDSYLSGYFTVNRKYYPSAGEKVTIYGSGLDYVNELDKLDNLTKTLSEQTDIIDSVDSWVGPFVSFVQKETKTTGFPKLNETFFNSIFIQFLFNSSGVKYRSQFRFETPAVCGQPAPKILLSEFTVVHKLFSGPKQHVPAMLRVKSIVENSKMSGKIFPLANAYSGWETDQVISRELLSDLGLSTLCVFITTTIFIGHFVTSFTVLIIVIVCMVEVIGFMHFWGLTIETVSCIILTISTGLVVDYSAHIAHSFLVEEVGTRDERAKHTLTHMGPAVLNGAFSTFLAFILLSSSSSHVFQVFFRIFFLVVVFGIYFGLIVLPVVLSLIGPTQVSRGVVPLRVEDDQDLVKTMRPPSASPTIASSSTAIPPPVPVNVLPSDKTAT